MSKLNSTLRFNKVDFPLIKYLLIISLIMFTVISGSLIGNYGQTGFNLVITSIIMVIICAVILFQPFLGLTITIVSASVQMVYPEVPIGTSILSLIGIVTLFGYLINHRKYYHSYTIFSPLLIIAGIFVLWLTISNPSAALAGSSRGMALFTYGQLLVLLWLTSNLMTVQNQKSFMIIYLTIALFVAILAIIEGEIGATFGAISRASTLTGNANGVALHLSINVIISLYLRKKFDHIVWWRRFFPFVFIILTLGVVFTFSRLGIASLIIGILIFFFIHYRFDKISKKNIQKLFLLLSILMLLIVPWTYWELMYESIFYAISGRQDQSIDIRIGGLWPSAIRAWLDHPFTGVGIGQYRNINILYLDSIYLHRSGTAVHNVFLNVLVETGLIGFSIFIIWISVIIHYLITLIKNRLQTEQSELAVVWLIVLIQFLILGLAHNAPHDKLLWFIAGISVVLLNDTTQPRLTHQQD